MADEHNRNIVDMNLVNDMAKVNKPDKEMDAMGIQTFPEVRRWKLKAFIYFVIFVAFLWIMENLLWYMNNVR